MEQELLTLPEHPSSPQVFYGVRVTRSLVLCVMFCNRCLSFKPLCCLVLRFTDSDYLFCILKFSIANDSFELMYYLIVNGSLELVYHLTPNCSLELAYQPIANEYLELVYHLIDNELAFLIVLMKSLIETLYSGTCLIRHTMGPGKCVGLYRMLEYSGFS